MARPTPKHRGTSRETPFKDVYPYHPRTVIEYGEGKTRYPFRFYSGIYLLPISETEMSDLLKNCSVHKITHLTEV